MSTQAEEDGPPPSHRRTQSAPPITVEDHSNPSAPRQPSDSPIKERVPEVPPHAPPGTLAPEPPRLENEHFHRRRKKGSWARQRSPGVEWKQKWDQDTWKNGRVLLVDYISREHSQDGKQRIVAQEFRDLDGLRRFYSHAEYQSQAALRVIHVQNARWATQYLLRKFNISHRDDLVGTAFGQWAQFDKPQMRAGKPVLKGKTFPTQRDPWRGIARTAFGLDWLKSYDAGRVDEGEGRQPHIKMMELNDYDGFETPNYAFDVFVQRLSVYVQRRVADVELPTDPDIRNPYGDRPTHPEFQPWWPRHATWGPELKPPPDYVPMLQSLDNGNTIIVFERSLSGSVNDTLIGAREEIESRWRRLTFYLSRDEISSDERLAVECMDLILKGIFKGLATVWEKYITMCATHVGILEDKIYENPADESRAPELWSNSSLWLKVEKLMYIHIDVIKEMMAELKELDDDQPREEWLGTTSDEYEKLANLIQEDLVKPTDSLSDLMYKSVEIRDSRHSLQLGTSMWRLSWITFIFLPLTFMVGFFGMNVDTFSDDPSIKWYFIVAVPFMVIILVVWYLSKHLIARSTRRGQPYADPNRRGIYEHLYHDLSEEHPQLWSRGGPRPDVELRDAGPLISFKWRLLRNWFAPERTVRAPPSSPDDAVLSGWTRFKRRCARRWLHQIHETTTIISDATTAGPLGAADLVPADLGESGFLGNGRPAATAPSAVTELLALATPVKTAEAEPAIAAVSVGTQPLSRPSAAAGLNTDGAAVGAMATCSSAARSAHPSTQFASTGLAPGIDAVRRGRTYASPGRSGGTDDSRPPRPSSGHSSGIMVDERVGSDDDVSSDGGAAEEGSGSGSGSGRRSRDETSFLALRVPRVMEGPAGGAGAGLLGGFE